MSHNLLHPDDPIRIHQDVVAHAIFSHPEIGSVGEREVDLDARRHPYRVGRCDYGGVAYGWALEDTSGFAKILVCEETGLLLGGHVIGHQAATLAQQLAQAMTFGITAERLAREQIWIHPALPEVLENALLDALRDSTRPGQACDASQASARAPKPSRQETFVGPVRDCMSVVSTVTPPMVCSVSSKATV